MPQRILLSSISLVAMLLPQETFAHGAVSYPISRQYQCYQDGNFWGNASAIPNAGCRASFQSSGVYPFVQWNEVSANPNPRTSQAAVEKAVPNGLICASGDTDKKGLDQPQNKGWKATPVKAGAKIKHTWDLSAAHNPSTHRIYITKKEANYQHRELRWSDIDLDKPLYNGVMPAAVTAANGKRTYSTDIMIPQDRTGHAIILSVWQREDPANEAFINCSDIQIISPTAQSNSVKPKPNNAQPHKVPAGATVVGISHEARH